MKVGSVTNVLNHVWDVGKWRPPDPLGTLATHVGVRRGSTIHPHDERVTSDAATDGAHL